MDARLRRLVTPRRAVTTLAETLTRAKWALGGLALMRVMYAVAALHLYLTNYTLRDELWGPGSVYPHESYREIAVTPLTWAYTIATSAATFELVFHIGILVAVAMLLGIGGRPTVVAHAFLHISLYLRNPLLMDGGDNIAHIALVFLCFVDSSSFLSWSWRSPVGRQGRIRAEVSNAIHNVALIAIAFQVLVVYWASAMYKIQGRMWQDGVALYYILRVPEFTWPGVSELVYENRWLVFALTWTTVWFQLAFPPLILTQRFRVAILGAAVVFHLGIALLMNLWTFSIYMIGTEAVFLPSRLAARLPARRQIARSRRLRPQEEVAHAARVGGL